MRVNSYGSATTLLFGSFDNSLYGFFLLVLYGAYKRSSTDIHRNWVSLLFYLLSSFSKSIFYNNNLMI